MLNGLLLGGLLALLSLGLNLDLRRDRRGLDLLRRADHVSACTRSTTCTCSTTGRSCSRCSRRSASSRCSGWILHQFVIRPVLSRRADQPAPRHRRRAVLPAGGRDARVRHRVQEPRHLAAVGAASARCPSLSARLIAFGVALAGMLALWLFLKTPISAPRSARSARTARSCR